LQGQEAAGIVPDSALDVLFSHRPDIKKLELTCANTNAVLLYVDLSNGVMESFINHLDGYIGENSEIDVFNMKN